MSGAVLSPSGERLLAKLPFYERQSWEIRAAVDSAAREMDRIVAARTVLQDNFFIPTADLYLHWWEALLRLPPNPVDKTLAQRRTVALAYLRAIRQSGTGLDWQKSISDIVGTNWTYEEYVPPAMRLTNLVTNPSAELDAATTDMARVADTTFGSSWAFEKTATATAARTVDGTIGGPTSFAVTPGERFNARVKGKLQADSVASVTSLTLQVVWYTGSGTVLALSIAGSAAGVGATSASVALVGRVSGSAAGVGTTSASVVVGTSVTGSAAGAGATTASVTTPPVLTANDLTSGSTAAPNIVNAPVVGTVYDLSGWLTVPATAAYAVLRVRANKSAAVSTVVTRWDHVLASMGASIPTYFDGYTAGYEWLGTPNASQSRKTSPPAYTVRLIIPYNAGSLLAADAEKLAREITPAHIDLLFGYGVGFIVGVSQVGQEAL